MLHASQIPGGPKFMSHESQLSPFQPLAHLLHIPGGSKFVSHVLQLGHAHPDHRQELQSPALCPTRCVTCITG